MKALQARVGMHAFRSTAFRSLHLATNVSPRAAALEGCINQQKQTQDKTAFATTEEAAAQQQTNDLTLNDNHEGTSWSDNVLQELGIGDPSGSFSFDTPLFSLDSSVVQDHSIEQASSDKSKDHIEAQLPPSSVIQVNDDVGPLGPLVPSDPAPRVASESTMKTRARSVGDGSCASRTDLIEAERYVFIGISYSVADRMQGSTVLRPIA